MDEVGEHQRQDHQKIATPWSTEDAARIDRKQVRGNSEGKNNSEGKMLEFDDSPSLVGAGAGACAAARAGMKTARTSAAATTKPKRVLAMAAAYLVRIDASISLLDSLPCPHVLPPLVALYNLP